MIRTFHFIAIPLLPSAALFATLLLTMMEPRPALAQYRFKTIALTGDIAPGSGGSGADVPFTFFDRETVINASGEVAFTGHTSSNTDGGDYGVFSTLGGTLNAVAFAQQDAPGSGGSGAEAPFTGFFSVRINDSGDVVFMGFTSANSDGGQTGIFSTTGGMLDAVAFEQQLAPGSGGSGAEVPFRGFSSFPTINASGEVAFQASTFANSDGGDSGVFSTVGGTLHPVAFAQQLAPGSGGSGAEVPFVSFLNPSINASGEVAFQASTSANSDGGDSGVFSTVGGTLHSVAFAQQLAPGSGGGGAEVPFISFYSPGINASGEVAFQAFTSANSDGGDSGIFSTVGGSLDAVAFAQQLAPGSGGSGAEVPFMAFFGGDFLATGINDTGEVVFVGGTSFNADGGDRGVFSSVGGSLDAVAFEAQLAPGSGGGGAEVPFTRLGRTHTINGSGEVAFEGLTSLNEAGGGGGIFTNVGGSLQAVVFAGDTIEVAPGDFRTVRTLDLNEYSTSGQPTGFNDSGELVFFAKFSDDSEGIFVATLVPEPSSGLLCSLWGLVFCCRRRCV